MIKKRHESIIHLLTSHPSVTIDQFCKELNTSPATIRRDLLRMEKHGYVIRIKGGAILHDQQKEGLKAKKELVKEPFEAEKKRIAEAAVKLIKEGDTIFVDAGSTNRYIADQLVKCSNITVVTNSLEIANKFISRKDISVIVCGGSLGEVNPASIVGPIAEKIISMFRANLCFLGTSGIDIKQGVTDPYLSSARIKEAMIEHSAKVVLVTDHSKFRVINTVYVCSLDKINHIITDDSAPREDIDYLLRKGIYVTLV